MGWYRRSNFAFDAIRNWASKAKPNNPIPNSTPRLTQHSSSSPPPSSTKSGFSGFALSSPISRNPAFEFGLKQSRHGQFLGGARRYYYVDRYQVRRFRPPRWYHNPRTALVVVLVGSGVLVTVYYGNLEAVPYTNRQHFVLLSKNLERQIGEAQFQQIKAAFKGKILPPLHPESVRVRLIAKDIIDALQRGLRHEEPVWSDLGYGSDGSGTHHDGLETLIALSESTETTANKWRREDEVLDDEWVVESQKKGKERGTRPDTSHLEGLKWEVLVVSEPVVNAFCLPGGKIVVFTGLLQHFRTDAEIATIIGHEV